MQASEPVLDSEKTQEDETEVEEDDSSEDPKLIQSAQPGVAKDTHQKSNQEDEILDGKCCFTPHFLCFSICIDEYENIFVFEAIPNNYLIGFYIMYN